MMGRINARRLTFGSGALTRLPEKLALLRVRRVCGYGACCKEEKELGTVIHDRSFHFGKLIACCKLS